MSKNLEQIGLKSVASQYDLFFIDIWGVIHNGIKLHENAVKVLEELSKNNKKFILLTNAPRPNLTVINTLKGMGLNKFSETVFTSGEASLRYILEKFKNKKFFHLGPPRDFDLFRKFENNKVNNIDAQNTYCAQDFSRNMRMIWSIIKIFYQRKYQKK